MPWTNYPNGISVTTQTGTVSGMINATSLTLNSNTGTAAGTVTAGTISAGVGIYTGALTGAVGSVYGAKTNLAIVGSMTVTITSALYDSAALIAPFACYPEIVLLNGATANITRSIRVVGGIDSTGTAAATLTIGSGTTAANGIYTTIGGTVITQGSQFMVTSAITATVNTAFLALNLISVAS